VDKPLSQEQPKPLGAFIGLFIGMYEGVKTSAMDKKTILKHLQVLLAEVERLQAIEAAHNRYKRALRKVICLNVPMPDEVFNLVNDALEGVESHEA
jgi:hypothetical protein